MVIAALLHLLRRAPPMDNAVRFQLVQQPRRRQLTT